MADFRPGWLISGARRPELACYQSKCIRRGTNRRALKHARVEYYPHSALLMTVHWCHLLQVRLLASGPVVLRPGFVFPRCLFACLEAPSAVLRAAGGGFWVDRRTGTVRKQARGKGTRVRDANILTWRTALSTPITGPGKSSRSGLDGLHNRGGKRISNLFLNICFIASGIIISFR